ncbi:MAG TPA: LD-carboxypeptidase [Thermoanaerobaculia bacterium]|jgi:muramoyltetrapeptide carboxypeptidase|nr:LD-carboxypeptidase [Thermoanaerobaculia bacterium]
MLIRPRALPRKGHVVVLAISSPSELPRIEAAVRSLEERGLRVTLAGNIDHRHRGYLAGDDDERTEQLNHYLKSEDVDAFFFARGGYGAMRILDQIDYDAITANPRPIIGFSDITALHQAIAVRCGVASFHGPMVNLDWFNGLSPEIEAWFWSMLSGEAPLTHYFTFGQVVFEGEAEGPLFGGCLSLTTALTGTPYDFWIDDGIWFFEDIEEPVYRIDRMLTHLRLSGRLKKIRAVVIGKLKDCGTDAEIDALLHEFFAFSNIPVIRDLPFGHHGDNLLMPIGRVVRVSTGNRTLTVTEPAVRL